MKRFLFAIFLFTVSMPAFSQWVVSDPSNLVQSIINSTNEIIQGSQTTQQMFETFQETRRIYQQGREQLDGIKNVSNMVKNYRKVARCVNMVGGIADTYVTNYDRMLRDENFSSEELSGIGAVYNQILQESSSSLSELQDLLTSQQYVMSDSERLERIDIVYQELDDYRKINDAFTRRNIAISLERAKENNDTRQFLELYGNNSERYW